MELKPYLRKIINTQIGELKEEINLNEEALSALQMIKTNNANYVVHLNSYWADEGESSVTVEHKGSLEESIKKAEQEYKTINRRNDIQAAYKVDIQLGTNRYSVPKEFWEEYIWEKI